MGFRDHAETEGTHTQLDHGAVVADLCSDVSLVDAFLEMGGKEHISGTVELVLEGEIVDVVEHGAGAEHGLAMFVEVHAEDLDEFGGWGGARCDD